MKGEFHGKPATVWSLGILLFRMLCGYFPDTSDFYRTNMNTWYKSSLTEGDLFITSSTILMQNFIGFTGVCCVDNAGI
jgi:serine/threonine protein kinase